MLPLILGTLTPMAQQDKISILGPRDDGTYVVEFRTAAGERLAISVPGTKAAVLKHFQAATADHAPIADEGALKAIELAQLIKEGRVVPVDTRDAGAFGRAHLPTAKHMPLEEIENRLAELHMMQAQPVLYCRSGDKTKAMADKLTQDGLPVMFLEGGLLGWESEGLPIERG